MAGAQSSDRWPMASPGLSSGLDIDAPQAERRQLTVLFVDVVDSTPLSERIDPEEFFRVIREYRCLCDEQIRSCGGHIARMIGDGLLAYFGLPQAHENDPERAVRAALAILEAVGEHEFGIGDDNYIQLGLRIGVNTGVVVVGTFTGEPAESREVFGSSTNIAARLQSIAPMNSVLIGSSTYELVKGAFRCSPMGEQSLKGISHPVQAWRVDGLAETESRFERATGSRLTPMIGRGAECEALLQLWKGASEGIGELAVVSGEPGIGKSRLIKALRTELKPQSCEILSLQCSPFHINTPLAPEIERLKRAAGMREDDRANVSASKLRALLRRAVSDPEDTMRYYGALLSIPACEGYEPADLASPSERERLFEVMIRTLIAASRNRPVLMVAEDVQWIDPTSIELVQRIMKRIASERVLLVITHRSDYDLTWLTGPSLRKVVLSKLGSDECADVVAAVAGDAAIPAKLIRMIVERTDGVPLFIEEFTRAVLAIRAEDRLLPETTSEPLIPASIHDSLMERLDRLSDAKRVAQVASVFGRQFSLKDLERAFASRGKTLERALQVLEWAGILDRFEERRYAFHHAMIQDAAYSSLIREERRDLHARVAALVRQDAPIAESSQPAVLGHHYSRANMIAEAVEAWLEAGKSALRRSATKEAVAHLRAGLGLVSKLPESEARFTAEIALQSNLAMAYTAIAGWSDPNVYGPYHRALSLCDKYGTVREKSVVLWGYSIAKLVNCELADSLRVAEDFLRLAREWRDEEAELMALTAALLANFFLGRLIEAHQLTQEIFNQYRSVEHRKLVQVYQHDPKVVALVYSGRLEWLLGRPQAARLCCQGARQLAAEIGHPFMRAFALILGAYDHWCEGDLKANLACIEEGMRVAKEYGYPMYAVIGPLWATGALASRDPSLKTMEALCLLLNKLPADDRCIQVPFYKALLAAEFGRMGEVERARTLAASAEDIMKRTGERWLAPEVYRVRGTLLCLEPNADLDSARRLFTDSLRSARELGAVGWELRAAISLASLLRTDGKKAKAHNLLRTVRRRFPPGETSADLRKAEHLLDELESR
jgi:class 3 adenylate cyclase/tetratricopeptide (TPR) repeat protein/ABC-type cobalamin/Fe3+-siderophores transport system ATPase subunit